MANLLRFYIDKTQDSEHPGAHSRVIDVGNPDGEPDGDKAREAAEKRLNEDEEINSVASISVDFPNEYDVIWEA